MLKAVHAFFKSEGIGKIKPVILKSNNSDKQDIYIDIYI